MLSSRGFAVSALFFHALVSSALAEGIVVQPLPPSPGVPLFAADTPDGSIWLVQGELADSVRTEIPEIVDGQVRYRTRTTPSISGNRLDRLRGDAWESVSSDQLGIGPSALLTTVHSSDSTLFVGTDRGLWRAQIGPDGAITPQGQISTGLSGQWVTGISSSSYGVAVGLHETESYRFRLDSMRRTWTEAGGFTLEGASGWTPYPATMTDASWATIAGADVSHIAISDLGTVAVATSEGVTRWSAAGGWTQYLTGQGFPGGTVNALVAIPTPNSSTKGISEPVEATFYAATQTGLYALQADFWGVVGRSASQNILSDGAAVHDIFASESGTVWLSTADGLVRYTPADSRWEIVPGVTGGVGTCFASDSQNTFIFSAGAAWRVLEDTAPTLNQPFQGQEFVSDDAGSVEIDFNWEVKPHAVGYRVFIDGVEVSTVTAPPFRRSLGPGRHKWYVMAQFVGAEGAKPEAVDFAVIDNSRSAAAEPVIVYEPGVPSDLRIQASLSTPVTATDIRFGGASPGPALVDIDADGDEDLVVSSLNLDDTVSFDVFLRTTDDPTWQHDGKAILEGDAGSGELSLAQLRVANGRAANLGGTLGAGIVVQPLSGDVALQFYPFGPSPRLRSPQTILGESGGPLVLAGEFSSSLPRPAFADFDGDGLADMIALDAAGELHYYKALTPNGTSPRFAAGAAVTGPNGAPFRIEGWKPFDLAAADLDADGKVDLAFTTRSLTRSSSRRVLIAFNQGTTGRPTFPALRTQRLIIEGNDQLADGAQVAIGNYNADGIPDFFIGRKSGEVWAYVASDTSKPRFYGTGPVSFEVALDSPLPSGAGPEALAAIDRESDGKVEVLGVRGDMEVFDVVREFQNVLPADLPAEVPHQGTIYPIVRQDDRVLLDLATGARQSIYAYSSAGRLLEILCWPTEFRKTIREGLPAAEPIAFSSALNDQGLVHRLAIAHSQEGTFPFATKVDSFWFDGTTANSRELDEVLALGAGTAVGQIAASRTRYDGTLGTYSGTSSRNRGTWYAGRYQYLDYVVYCDETIAPWYVQFYDSTGSLVSNTHGSIPVGATSFRITSGPSTIRFWGTSTCNNYGGGYGADRTYTVTMTALSGVQVGQTIEPTANNFILGRCHGYYDCARAAELRFGEIDKSFPLPPGLKANRLPEISGIFSNITPLVNMGPAVLEDDQAPPLNNVTFFEFADVTKDSRKELLSVASNALTVQAPGENGTTWDPVLTLSPIPADAKFFTRDLNRDGFLDIVLWGDTEVLAFIHKGQTTLGFERRTLLSDTAVTERLTATADGERVRSVVACDQDDDGNEDITALTTNRVLVWKRTVAETPSTPQMASSFGEGVLMQYTEGALANPTIVQADLNGDGVGDLVWIDGKSGELVARFGIPGEGLLRFESPTEILTVAEINSAFGFTGADVIEGAPGADGLSSGVEVSGTVAEGEWAHYHIDVPASAARLDIELTGTGDADLYVRRDGQPTSALWDFRPYQGSSNELVAVDSSTSPTLVAGRWYISVNGYSEATYSLRATVGSGIPAPNMLAPEIADLDLDGLPDLLLGAAIGAEGIVVYFPGIEHEVGGRYFGEPETLVTGLAGAPTPRWGSLLGIPAGDLLIHVAGQPDLLLFTDPTILGAPLQADQAAPVSLSGAVSAGGTEVLDVSLTDWTGDGRSDLLATLNDGECWLGSPNEAGTEFLLDRRILAGDQAISASAFDRDGNGVPNILVATAAGQGFLLDYLLNRRSAYRFDNPISPGTGELLSGSFSESIVTARIDSATNAAGDLFTIGWDGTRSWVEVLRAGTSTSQVGLPRFVGTRAAAKPWRIDITSETTGLVFGDPSTGTAYLYTDALGISGGEIRLPAGETLVDVAGLGLGGVAVLATDAAGNGLVHTYRRSSPRSFVQPIATETLPSGIAPVDITSFDREGYAVLFPDRVHIQRDPAAEAPPVVYSLSPIVARYSLSNPTPVDIACGEGNEFFLPFKLAPGFGDPASVLAVFRYGSNTLDAATLDLEAALPSGARNPSSVAAARSLRPAEPEAPVIVDREPLPQIGDNVRTPYPAVDVEFTLSSSGGWTTDGARIEANPGTVRIMTFLELEIAGPEVDGSYLSYVVDDPLAEVCGSGTLYLVFKPELTGWTEYLSKLSIPGQQRLKLLNCDFCVNVRTGEIKTKGQCPCALELPFFGTLKCPRIFIGGIGSDSASKDEAPFKDAPARGIVLADGETDSPFAGLGNIFQGARWLGDLGGAFKSSIDVPNLDINNPLRRLLSFDPGILPIRIRTDDEQLVSAKELKFGKATLEVFDATQGKDGPALFRVEARNLALKRSPDEIVFDSARMEFPDYDLFLMEIDKGGKIVGGSNAAIEAGEARVTVGKMEEPLVMTNLKAGKRGISFDNAPGLKLAGMEARALNIAFVAPYDSSGRITMKKAWLRVGDADTDENGTFQVTVNDIELPFEHSPTAKSGRITIGDPGAPEFELAFNNSVTLSRDEINIPEGGMVFRSKSPAFEFTPPGLRLRRDLIEISDVPAVKIAGVDFDLGKTRLSRSEGFYTREAKLKVEKEFQAEVQDLRVRDGKISIGGGGFEYQDFGFKFTSSSDVQGCEGLFVDSTMTGIPLWNQAGAKVCFKDNGDFDIQGIALPDIDTGTYALRGVELSFIDKRFEGSVEAFVMTGLPTLGVKKLAIGNGKLERLWVYAQFDFPTYPCGGYDLLGGFPLPCIANLKRIDGDFNENPLMIRASGVAFAGASIAMPFAPGQEYFLAAANGQLLYHGLGYVDASGDIRIFPKLNLDTGMADGGYQMARAHAVFGNVYVDGRYLGRGAWADGHAVIPVSALLVVDTDATAWYYTSGDYGLDGDASLQFFDRIPVIGGKSFAGAVVHARKDVFTTTVKVPAFCWKYPVFNFRWCDKRDCFRIGRWEKCVRYSWPCIDVSWKEKCQYLDVKVTVRQGNLLKGLDDDGSFTSEGYVLTAPQDPTKGIGGGITQVTAFGNYRLLSAKSAARDKAHQMVTKGSGVARTFEFDVPSGVSEAIVRADFSRFSGDATLTVTFPDGREYTASNTPDLFGSSAPEIEPADGFVPVLQTKRIVAAKQVGEPSVKEVLYYLGGSYRMQTAAVYDASGVATGQLQQGLDRAPLPRGKYRVTLESSGGNADEALVEFLMGNQKPILTQGTLEELDGSEHRVTWEVKDFNGDSVNVRVLLSPDPTQPERGLVVGKEGGYMPPVDAAEMTFNTSVLEENSFSDPVAVVLVLDDGYDEPVYERIGFVNPPRSANRPPAVQGVVTHPGDGYVDVFWNPISWDAPDNVSLVGYTILAQGIKADGSTLPPIFTSVPARMLGPDGISLVRAPTEARISNLANNLQYRFTVSAVAEERILTKAARETQADPIFTSQTSPAVLARPLSLTNNPPEITSVPPATALIGQDFVYVLTARDPESDELSVSFAEGTADPVWTQANLASTGNGSWEMRWRPLREDAGKSLFVDIQVTDSRGASVSQQFTISVADFAQQEASRALITSQPPRTVALGSTLDYVITTTGFPENSPPALVLVSAPRGMAVGASNQLIWTPTVDQLGHHQVELRVVDGSADCSTCAGSTVAEQTFIITVLPASESREVSATRQLSPDCFLTGVQGAFIDVRITIARSPLLVEDLVLTELVPSGFKFESAVGGEYNPSRGEIEWRLPFRGQESVVCSYRLSTTGSGLGGPFNGTLLTGRSTVPIEGATTLPVCSQLFGQGELRVPREIAPEFLVQNKGAAQPQALTFDLVNDGASAISYTATITYESPSKDWLSVSSVGGSISGLGTEQVVLTPVPAKIAAMQAGQYDARVIFSNPANPDETFERPIRLRIESNGLGDMWMVF